MTSRINGRSESSIRDPTLSFDNLARVDGSARFGFGPNAQALVSLSGPIEVRLAAEQASQATLEVHLRPVANVPATESKSLSSSLASILAPSLILTQNPRTLIQLVVQTLIPAPKWKDGLFASIINASTLSLLNSGSVPMKGVICAVALGRLGELRYVVDPSDEEVEKMDGGGCFAFMFSDVLGSSESDTGSTCVWSNWRSWGAKGGFDEQEIIQTRELAREAAKDVWERMKKLVQDTEHPPLKAFLAPQSKKDKVKAASDEDDDAKMEI
ncbi:exosome component 5 [Moniliophthora roreri MCA 2997]|uniref:Exosome component 5 n=2 Tax=Moniliophthora roreri TaxID=221103 RepID=V2WH26_MONRO|nr:exosome component 5 [Moniliophthora roreri MCA 2997]KAI3605406.1 exosome component 5 [Moniliophthora roreri]